LSVARAGDLNDDGSMAFTQYALTPSNYIEGEFVAIGGTSNSVPTSANMNVVVEA
jgi:hypothetical protein